MTRYLSAEKLTSDDFGQPLTGEEGEIVYDAATIHQGVWATMTQASYDAHARKQGLGLGKGQKYRRDASGQLHKVEG